MTHKNTKFHLIYDLSYRSFSQFNLVLAHGVEHMMKIAAIKRRKKVIKNNSNAPVKAVKYTNSGEEVLILKPKSKSNPMIENKENINNEPSAIDYRTTSTFEC